jgi:hypothetical protein
LEGVVSGLGQHGYRQEHGEMSFDVRCEADPIPGVEDESLVAHVGEKGEDEGEEHGDADEVHQHAPEGQGIDIESGVFAEKGIGEAELLAVQEEQRLLPAAAVRDPHYDRDHDRDEEQQPARPAAPGQQLEDLASLIGLHSPVWRGELAGRPHAPIEQSEEQEREEEAHAKTGQERSPEDVGVTRLLVPEVVRPVVRDDLPYGHQDG